VSECAIHYDTAIGIFYNVLHIYGGGFYMEESSTLTITSLDFTGDTLTTYSSDTFGGLLAAQTYCTIIVDGLTASGITLLENGGLFYLYRSFLTISNAQVSEIHDIDYGGVFYLNYGSNLSLTDSTFESLYNFISGGLLMLSFSDATLTGVTVENVYNEESKQYGSFGGAFAVLEFDDNTLNAFQDEGY